MSAADDWDAADQEWIAAAVNARCVGDAQLASVIARIKELRRLYAVLKDLNRAGWVADYYAWELESNIGPRRHLPLGAMILWKADVEYQLRQYGQQLGLDADHPWD